MKPYHAPSPAGSQFEVLRKWFLWTMAGMILSGLFWGYVLQQPSDDLLIPAVHMDGRQYMIQHQGFDQEEKSSREHKDSLLFR